MYGNFSLISQECDFGRLATKLTNMELLLSFFWKDMVELLKNGVELVPAAETALLELLSYPLHSSLARYVLCRYFVTFL